MVPWSVLLVTLLLIAEHVKTYSTRSEGCEGCTFHSNPEKLQSARSAGAWLP